MFGFMGFSPSANLAPGPIPGVWRGRQRLPASRGGVNKEKAVRQDLRKVVRSVPGVSRRRPIPTGVALEAEAHPVRPSGLTPPSAGAQDRLSSELERVHKVLQLSSFSTPLQLAGEGVDRGSERG